MGKFKIKISPTWFSDQYVVFKYTTNGVFWKTIRYCQHNPFSNWYYMGKLTSHYSNAESLLMKKFKTLENVKKYEKEQRNKVKKKNDEIRKQNKKDKEEKRRIYKKFG